MEINLNLIDYFCLFGYLAGVFGFGLYMSRREETPEDFFLAGRTLPWYAIALSLFATNISSGSLIGLAGDGYRVGMAVGTLEWGALLGLFMLTFIFLPYYQKRRVCTMPEFMELRYNLPVRIIFSSAVLIFEIFISIPFMLYAGGLAVEVMFGIPYQWAALGIAVFVGAYTVFGGLGAVVWTDVVQGCFIILGGLIVTLFGLHSIGGVDELMAQASDKMHVCLPASHPEYPFPATMIGGYFLVTVYYWCLNQTMVQRTLGGKTEWDSRMGAMAACFIKIMLPFIIVIPGIIAFVKFPELDSADKALPTLIKTVVPPGMSGIMIAAVIAALMSSADSALNSWATLFTYDLYKRLLNPNASDKNLILIGRLASIFVLVATLIRTLFLKDTSSILQFLLNGLAYISCPIVAIFMIGIFWKRATSLSALVTMILSPFICYFSQHMHKFTGLGPNQTSIVYWLPIALGICLVIQIGVSLFSKPKPEEEIKELIWTRQQTLKMGADLLLRLDGSDMKYKRTDRFPVWKDYRIVGIVAMALMCMIIWILR